jgi:WSTF, HB1, Itc1p, MBD9 motif 1
LAWEVKEPLRAAAWQQHMLAYLERKEDTPAQAAARDGPAAVAGHLATAPASEAGSAAERNVAAVAACGVAEYPEGGYWGLDPGTRVSMLRALVHDALDTWHFRWVPSG